ncbi:P-loop NTPase fold protein [Serratia sp. DD3]|uniref:P-loop NTPase fold protein n=1 Tax=Serratia sp. DD3 TaxID=1410619 RepID=UPI0003C52607|nr:P-loop NTPase fold protein [Serratia sp. DD3]KEY56453.1 putative P-loop ATPase [Serratia sp. DD3]KEY59384.1 putative P-loop ATPase [Serratia sp. DD3]
MELKLQKESPSDNDLFEGQQHHNVALKMSEVIINEDIKIIGLEGCLGSGKSTIIHFIKKNLKESNFRFIEFDAEIYHFGTTKKALIDLIYRGLKETPGVDKKELQDHRDSALGNTLRYTRHQKSKISFWTIAFLLSSILSIQSLRYFLNDINKLFTGSTMSFWLFLIEVVCLLSPFMVLGAFKLCGKRSEDFTVSDILKKNSEDTITEKMLISREVGTLELYTALNGFIQCLPTDVRFILIIDNLDRINSGKVKELWSDMELISATAGEKLKIVLPYSAEHVSKSLSEDSGEGREFISKRIPVNFLVPPILSAGWRHGFATLWSETLADPVPEACYEVAELLERFLPQNHKQITPRFMKKMINDIKITSLTLPAQANHHVLIAFYLLLVRYAGHPFTNLMLDYQEGTLNELKGLHGLSDTFCAKMLKTQAQFARLYHYDHSQWREYLLCIHYQTHAALAKSELLDEPLRAALNNTDLAAFMALYGIFGFENAWRRQLHGTDPVQWCLLLADVEPEMQAKIAPIMQEVIILLDQTYARHVREQYHPKFVQALCILQEKGLVKGHEDFIARQSSQLMDELNRYNEATNLDDESFNLELFEEVDRYAVLTGKNYLKYLSKPLSGPLYYCFLFGYEEDFSALEIIDLSLNFSQTALAIQAYLSDDSEGDIFAPGIIRHVKINNKPLNSLIASPEPIQSAKNMEMFISGNEIKSRAAFRQLVLNNTWHTTSYISLYAHQVYLLEHYPSEVAAHALTHMIAIGSFTSYDSYMPFTKSSDFMPVFGNYLLYLQSFERLIPALEVPELAVLVIPALTSLMENSRVYALSHWQYVTQSFPLIVNAVGSPLALSFLAPWESHVVASIVKNGLTDLAPAFLQAMWAWEGLQNTKDALYQGLFKLIGEKDILLDAMETLHPNYQAVLQHLLTYQISYPGTVDILAFHDWYVDTDLATLLKPSHVRALFNLLTVEQQDETIKALIDVLLTRDVDVKRHIVLLQDFGDRLIYEENGVRGSRRTVARLFSYAPQYPAVANWLDSQTFHFSKWSPEDSLSAVTGIVEHREHFPKLLTTRYVSKRLNEIDEAISEHTDEHAE